MNTQQNIVTAKRKQQTGHNNTALKVAISALLMAGSVGVAGAAQDITAKEAEQINAALAPVVNPEANAEKVGSVPEDPAALVGTRFTYQGTLRLNGDRAQGPYDFRFRLFTQATGGTEAASPQFRYDVPVTDGLFSTELDFGQTPIDGDDIFLQIEVRDGASTGAYTILSPRQRINATPYAVRALTGGDGGVSSPWTVSGTTISYDGGRVVMGAGPSNSFVNINAPNSENDLFRVRSDFSTKMKVTKAGGVSIGLGSDSAVPPDDGLEVFGATTLHANLNVLDNGKVGIGTTTPQATTNIVASAGEDPLRVQTGGDLVSRLWVKSDGTTLFKGNVKQEQQYGGTLKAAVFLDCGGTAGAAQSIARQYNGVSSTAITATDNGNGKCIIDFPFNINDRFWSVSAPNTSTGINRGAMCDVGVGGNDKLYCTRFRTDTDSAISGQLMLLVY